METDVGKLLTEWMRSSHAGELHLKCDGETWRMIVKGEYYHLESARDAADHSEVDGVHATLCSLLRGAVAENYKTENDEAIHRR